MVLLSPVQELHFSLYQLLSLSGSLAKKHIFLLRDKWVRSIERSTHRVYDDKYSLSLRFTAIVVSSPLMSWLTAQLRTVRNLCVRAGIKHPWWFKIGSDK